MKKILLTLFILRGVISAEGQCTLGNCNNGYGEATIQKEKGQIFFKGNFANKKPEGKGAAVFPNGARYEGSWHNGMMEGFGILTLKDGTVYKGDWVNSRFMGKEPTFTNVEPPTDNIKDLTGGDIFSDDTHIAPPPISQIWGLAVGVSQYESLCVSPLKYPHSDAYKMYSFWKSLEGGSLDDNHSQVLVNDQATKKGVLDSMRQMFYQANVSDLVVFFYSGHGLKGAFLPTDYDCKSVRLFHDEINTLLANCPAQYKLVIADACNSGSYIASKSGQKTPVEEGQEAFFRELNRANPGTAFILSSLADEESLEVSTLHHSIFSYFVVLGLKGEANTNKDNIITVQELFDYVYKNVTSYARELGKKQTPVIKGNYDPNMPVAIIRK